MNLWVVGLIATALAAITWLLPHNTTTTADELWFDIGHALLFLEVLF
ncbi:MAG: hypothetical protein AAB834_07125 [Patescibacteria group bacterium]